MINNDSPNAIIPKILTCSKEYTSNINNRLKLNTIFSDFEQTANSTFNKFITLSNARYKSVKYGNSLDSILQTQKTTYKDLATEINENDIFVNDNEISNEKKKLLKNNNLTKVKELNNLREQLRNTTKDITKFEKLKREKLKLKIEKKRMQMFNPHKPKTNKVHKSNKTNNKDKVYTEIEQEEEDNDTFVKQLLDHDKKYINRNMNRYFKYLDLLNELTPPGKKLPMKKDILNKMPSSNILPRYMNCLNYKEEKPIIIFTKKESKKDIDINKLTQYSKLAKARSKKLNLTIPDNNNKSKSKVILISRNNSECKNTISFKGVNNEDAKFKTINIIKTNAEHYLNLKDKFIKKRNKINKDIGVNLPSLETYEDNISNERLQCSKHSNFTKTLETYSSALTECQNQNCTITNINKSNRNIAAQFKVIYNLKQSKWKEEDKQRELINNMKYNNMLETNQFLQGVKKSNRLIQLYVDEYSLRDKQVNTNIKEFNKMMGSRSYFNKKTININLNRYMDAKERNEKLKKLHHHEEKPSKSIEQQIRDEIHENYLNQLQKERNTINNCTDNNSELKGNYDLVTLNYARSAKKKISKSQEYKEKQYQKFLNRKKEYVNYLQEQKKSTLTKMDL